MFTNVFEREREFCGAYLHNDCTRGSQTFEREREREGERCEKLGGRKKKAQVICLTKRHI
jgi:hypothetical protein